MMVAPCDLSASADRVKEAQSKMNDLIVEYADVPMFVCNRLDISDSEVLLDLSGVLPGTAVLVVQGNSLNTCNKVAALGISHKYMIREPQRKTRKEE